MIWLLAFLTINSKTEFRTGRNQKCQRISDNDQTDRAAWLRSLVMLTTVRLLVTTTVPTPARTSYHHHGKPTRHKPEQYTNYSIINYCYTCFLYHSYTILFLYEFFTILCPPCSRAPLWWGLDILPAVIIVVNQEAPSHLWCVSQVVIMTSPVTPCCSLHQHKVTKCWNLTQLSAAPSKYTWDCGENCCNLFDFLLK